MHIKGLLVVLLAVVALATTAAASADSTPIGALPAGPVSTIHTQRGELIAFALPARSNGVWRIARAYKASIVRQVSEATVGSSSVLVFRARRAGSATVTFALTKSDASSKALESRRFTVHVK